MYGITKMQRTVYFIMFETEIHQMKIWIKKTEPPTGKIIGSKETKEKADSRLLSKDKWGKQLWVTYMSTEFNS